jgi:hypothetical protein
MWCIILLGSTLVLPAHSHAARRLHFYAGGGYSWFATDANLVELKPQTSTHGRFAIGIDINKRIDTDRLEFILEADVIREVLLYGAGFKLNFDSPGRTINYYLAGLAGPPIEQAGWFGFQVGMEFFRVGFVNVGFIGKRSKDSEIIPVTVGVRL